AFLEPDISQVHPRFVRYYIRHSQLPPGKFFIEVRHSRFLALAAQNGSVAFAACGLRYVAVSTACGRIRHWHELEIRNADFVSAAGPETEFPSGEIAGAVVPVVQHGPTAVDKQAVRNRAWRYIDSQRQ